MQRIDQKIITTLFFFVNKCLLKFVVSSFNLRLRDDCFYFLFPLTNNLPFRKCRKHFNVNFANLFYLEKMFFFCFCGANQN